MAAPFKGPRIVPVLAQVVKPLVVSKKLRMGPDPVR